MQRFEFIFEEDVQTRLDVFLKKQFEDQSRENLKQHIKDGKVLLNSTKALKPNLKLNQSDKVEILLDEVEQFSDITATKIPLNIIYEDNDIIVIDKQSGLTVHPGNGNYSDTLANGLKYHFKENLSDLSGAMRPGIVHRLDKDTSGLIVAAKNNFAHYHLSKQLKNREIERKYIAIIWGCPNAPEGKIIGNINRMKSDRTKMSVCKTGGKEAITNYRVLKKLKHDVASIVECKLETGRTHQIRVHFSYKKHPLIGDKVYGGSHHNQKNLHLCDKNTQNLLKNFSRQALHSTTLAFFHPRTKEKVNFSSPIGSNKNTKDLEDLINLS